MKKYAIVLAVLALLLLQCGCLSEKTGETAETHNIIYELGGLEDVFICKPSSAKHGDAVEIRTEILYDADIHVYADGKEISKTHFDSDYWGYSFTMPDKDVTVTASPYTKKEIVGTDGAHIGYLFVYRDEEAASMRGLYYEDEYYTDIFGKGHGICADGAGISFELVRMSDPPTIRYDVDGKDTITLLENGKRVEKPFMLWKYDDSFETVDYGNDIYAYLKDHPGTYFLTAEIKVDTVIEGGERHACYTEGVRLIAE